MQAQLAGGNGSGDPRKRHQILERHLDDILLAALLAIARRGIAQA
jgi:hypothetical protein